MAECDKRREFISGFTGSAGTAVVTPTKALLWTDGRYHLQASQQLDENWTVMKDGLPNVPKLEEWLSKVSPPHWCSEVCFHSSKWWVFIPVLLLLPAVVVYSRSSTQLYVHISTGTACPFFFSNLSNLIIMGITSKSVN